MDNQKKDYRKEARQKKVPKSTVSRDMVSLSKDTGNVYQTLMIIAKRANQISQEIKESLQESLLEFAPATTTEDKLVDNVMNEEQINCSRSYERIPKSTLIATQEYKDGELYYELPEDKSSK